MRRYFARIGCLLAICTLGGCAAMFGPHELPPDPLFANRKPIETKAATGPPAATPYSEPTPPNHP